MENKNSCSVKGVGCDVSTCKYNNMQYKCCTAEHINVKNETATSKSDTFCGTFVPKAGV